MGAAESSRFTVVLSRDMGRAGEGPCAGQQEEWRQNEAGGIWQAGLTQAGEDWSVAHGLRVCGVSESRGGWAPYALGHFCPRLA